MCLYTRQICPIKARKDIVCYKAFIERSKMLETPFMNTRILNPEYTEECVLMDDSDKEVELEKRCFIAKDRVYNGSIIDKGMIHAFRTRKGSKKYFHHIYCYLSIYKCIIPKGTLYYIGINEDICAKQMLIVEKVISNTAEIRCRGNI